MILKCKNVLICGVFFTVVFVLYAGDADAFVDLTAFVGTGTGAETSFEVSGTGAARSSGFGCFLDVTDSDFLVTGSCAGFFAAGSCTAFFIGTAFLLYFFPADPIDPCNDQ